MNTTADQIKDAMDVALMLAASGYNVFAINLTMRTSIQIGDPDGLPLPADVQTITDSGEFFHHKARLGQCDVIWLTDKPKVVA